MTTKSHYIARTDQQNSAPRNIARFCSCAVMSINR
jgi:hypothetical protein